MKKTRWMLGVVLTVLAAFATIAVTQPRVAKAADQPASAEVKIDNFSFGPHASAAILIWSLAWWRTRQERADSSSLASGYWALSFIAVLVVALTGHLGGILSGVEVPN
jgi:uncharacterized membrane protein